jgi:DNA-binding MarR family transcriptional regulator
MTEVREPMTTYLVGRIDRIVRRALEVLVEDQGVSVVGYTAMSVLAARPGLSNAELARRSFVTAQGMSQTLTSLAAQGLIRRTPATDNRRVQLVELTDRGRRVVDVCTQRVATYERELLAVLSPGQRAELNAMLLAIVDSNRTGGRRRRQPVSSATNSANTSA